MIKKELHQSAAHKTSSINQLCREEVQDVLLS